MDYRQFVEPLKEMEDNTFYGFMFLPMLTGGTIEEYHKGFLHC